MMPNTLEAIAIELAKAISPVGNAFQSPQNVKRLLNDLGWELPPGAGDIGLAGIQVEGVIEKLQAVINATPEEREDELQMAAKIVELIAAIAELIEQIIQFADNLDSTLAGLGDYVSRSKINEEFFPRLLDYILITYVYRNFPGSFSLLQFFTIFELRQLDADSANYQSEHVRLILHYDRLPLIISDPGNLIQEGYGWGTSDFSAEKILANFAFMLQMLGGEVQLRSIPRSVEEALLGRSVPEADSEAAVQAIVNLIKEVGIQGGSEVNLSIYQARASAPAAKDGGIGFMPVIQGTTDLSFPIFENLSLELDSDFDFSGGLNLILRPDQPPQVESQMFEGDTSVPATGKLLTGLQYGNEESEPTTLLSFPGGSLLELQQLSLKGGVKKQASGDFDPLAELSMKGLRLIIGLGSADSFVQESVGEDGLSAEFDLTLGWSPEGIYFYGSAALELKLPTHIELGPLEIQAIYLQLLAKDDATINIELSSGLALQLGPLAATVERLGVQAAISFPEEGGNLGPANLELGFKPPNGVGLAVDAGVVKGGGYLYFDFDREEYAGALELTFSEVVSLKAIGLITTKLPDGSKGFSLLVIISAEFGTGIQLGFGFSLLGVGGLLGLNRTMRLEPLAEGVRTGAVENVMFPTNIVENAPQIISDLRSFFPPENDRFLIGPMAKIGWGTPTLISLSLGIIIEIPGNIAILGVLKVALPTEDEAVLVLQVKFIGAIEFDKDRLWFFASMYNSRVLFITIDGEMGLLMAWGDDASFVSAVGGFHPAFNPPPLPFPNPKRISLNLLDESWGKIRVMGYFAVTSNTVQFGARVEVFFGLSALNVQGHIGFDALFQFSPFYFIIQVSASFSVKVFGAGLFSVKIKMSLEGPTPWRAKGTGSISLLFFDINVHFDFTWGEEKNTTLPPIEVMPLMKAEFNKLSNWKALAPASSSLLVSLNVVEGDEEELVLHPVGSLQVSQRKAPLDLTLDKVGTRKPRDANKFTLKTRGSDISESDDLMEQFPLAQFQEMENAKKLSRPSFEKEHSGVELSIDGEQLATGKAVKRIVRYEQVIIDTGYKRHLLRFVDFVGSLFRHFLGGNAAAQSEISYKAKKELSPFKEKISVSQTGYTVASMADNKAMDENASFASEAMAREYMSRQLSKDPHLKDKLHVIPQHELNSAA